MQTRQGRSGQERTVRPRAALAMTASTTYSEYETEWRNAVDHLTGRFETADVSRDELRSDLQTLIDTALQYTSQTWDVGDPCPDCGNPDLTRWVSYAELTRHDSGEVTFQDGSNCGVELAWDCPDCDTVIAVAPAALLIPAAPGDEPENIDALRTALDHHLTTTDWRTGTACPACESHYIGEQNLDAYGTIADDGTYTQAAHGERVSSLEYWCDACGTTLRENYGTLLMNALYL